MWQFLLATFRQRIVSTVALPIAVVFGAIGYVVEGWVSDRYTPYNESIKDKRVERLLQEELTSDPTGIGSLSEKKFVPKTVFEKNVSPSLENVQKS